MFPTGRGRRSPTGRSTTGSRTGALRRGLPDCLCVHCLRHTYVTRLIEAGYDARFVTEQFGHSHAVTTAIHTALSSDYQNTKGA
ncbi:tyrosine-type recombinase/integrase [Saccharothrix sp. NRRL B-16348]|uniref:tyrosine-type recombinase/integrase n=1 Tax=Saccharothrix sp. NRRL B-16348 TaxID=1415542 RepID=UPI000AB742CB|nr:tyrosine-type recombinase/integrase [Saccharothrix sp. NRRL B-16348]